MFGTTLMETCMHGHEGVIGRQAIDIVGCKFAWSQIIAFRIILFARECTKF